MKVAPLYVILHLFCFSELSYLSLWSIPYDSHHELDSGRFYGTRTGAQIVCHSFRSFSASSYLQAGCCSPNICKVPSSRKAVVCESSVLQSRSFQGRSWTEQWGPCLRHKGKAGSLHTESSHLLPTILCLQSDFCVSPQLFYESPPKAEAAVTHAGTAVPCLECSWLDWHLSAS